MALSFQQCYDASISYSALNKAELYDQDMALIHMSHFQQKVFILASLYNPDYFGLESTSATRADEQASFNLGATPTIRSGLVERVEVEAITGTVSGVSTGDEINLISLREPEIHLSPRAYLRDKRLFQYAAELGSDGSNFVSQVRLWYTKIPAFPTDLSQQLDLDDVWAHLVIVPMAAVLALWDQRPEDRDRLMQEHTQNQQLFIELISSHRFSTAQSLLTSPIASAGTQGSWNLGGPGGS